MPLLRKPKQGVKCLACNKEIKNVVPHYKKHHEQIYRTWFARLGTSEAFVINEEFVN